MTRLRAYLANWFAGTDVAELRKQLAWSQLQCELLAEQCMQLSEQLRRSELTVRSYERHVKPGARA